MKKTKGIIAVSLGAFVAAECISPAFLQAEAGAAPAHEMGVPSSEIALLSESPVEVRHEKITFEACGDSGMFFALYRGEEEEYPAFFTAEYQLYNPTESDQTLRLAYTLGELPDYAGYPYADSDCLSLVSFSADGEVLEPCVRYAYAASDFDGETDPLFVPETPLTDFAFEAVLPTDRDKEENYLLRVECEYNPMRTRLLVPSNFRTSSFENGRVAVYLWVRDETETMSVGALGEEPKFTSLTVIPNNWGDFGDPVSGAQARQGKTFRTTFGEYVTGWFPKNIVMTEEDMFRCAAQYFSQSVYRGETGVLYGSMQNFFVDMLSRRFEYELTVPAGGQVVHTVRAPLFPEVDIHGCSYMHDFTNACKWAKYGGFSIEVKTDGSFALAASNFDFHIDTGKILLARDSLPMGELNFRLEPISMNCLPNEGEKGLSSELIVAFVILGVVAASGTGFAIFAIVRKKRRKANEHRANS